MSTPEIRFRDYILEEKISYGAGGILFRAFSPSENGGFGRRDLIYKAHDFVARDVNALHQVADRLAQGTGANHAGMLAPIACNYAPGELLLASEWIPGVPLTALIRSLANKNRPWPVPAALHLAGEIAKVLCYLQGTIDPLLGAPRPIVHGQIRPEHIFVTFGGQIKVLGLGMAELETFALQSQGGFVQGEANYSSPELASGRELDGRSDLFSLGVILWELIAGRALFPPCSREESVRILSEKNPPPPSQTRAEVPAELDAVLAKLLDRDMHLRYELGEMASQDISAVMKFRFPDFKPMDFATLCRENLLAELEKYKASVATPSKASEETKVYESPMAARAIPQAANKPTPSPVITIEKLTPAAPNWAPAQTAVEEEEEGWPIASAFTSGPLKALLAACALALVALPFVAPSIVHRSKGQREIARQRALKAMEKYGTLVFISAETDFNVKVNGKPVKVNQGTVSVVANQELSVVVEKPGYEEIMLTTQLMPDEEFSVPLEFKKLASQE